MPKIDMPYAKIATETEYKTVRKNNTGMCKFSILETKRQYNKDKEEYEVVDSWFWNAIVWGDKALEAATLSKGDVLDLSAQIKDGKNGQYVSGRAYLEQNTWKGPDGKKRSRPQLIIHDWDVRNFD